MFLRYLRVLLSKSFYHHCRLTSPMLGPRRYGAACPFFILISGLVFCCISSPVQVSSPGPFPSSQEDSFQYTTNMFYRHFLACALTCLLPLYVSNAQVSAATPVCLQSRSSTDPVAAALQSSVDSDKSVKKACDPSTQQIRVTPWTHTFYALDNYLFFNTSLQDLPSIGTPASTPTSYPGNQECAYYFNAIISLCLIQEKFWGGWIESKGLNYSSEYSK